jgi:glycosyltransferase involved in cell wall biosynthesis
MRIAFVSTILSYPWGGADTLWTAAAEWASARGDPLWLGVSELSVVHPRIGALAGRGATLFVQSNPYEPVALWRRAWRKRPWGTTRARRLRESLRAFAPDLVVLSCGGTYDGILEPDLFAWLRSSRTPYRIIANLQHEHPSLLEPDRIAARSILAGAERVFSMSPRNLELTRRHLNHPLPNAECLHNPMGQPAELAWPALDDWTFASLGRLEPVKGVDLIIQALAAVMGDRPGWRLNVYGRGPQLSYLEECARYCGIAAQVRFHGFVPVDEIWQHNHFLISGALDEGVPLTLPEAQLRGRPALATRVGGATEWIDPGRTGFICAAPTQELLTVALREAWDQRARWPEMGAAAARRARELYRPDDYHSIVA